MISMSLASLGETRHARYLGRGLPSGPRLGPGRPPRACLSGRSMVGGGGVRLSSSFLLSPGEAPLVADPALQTSPPFHAGRGDPGPSSPALGASGAGRRVSIARRRRERAPRRRPRPCSTPSYSILASRAPRLTPPRCRPSAALRAEAIFNRPRAVWPRPCPRPLFFR